MERKEFLDTLDEQGKMIFHGFEELDGSHPYLRLRPTEKGYHLCIQYGTKPEEEEVEFIQIWGEPTQKLETRFYWIENRLAITSGAKEKVRGLLEPPFEDTEKKDYGNMRFLFGKLQYPFREKEAKELIEQIKNAADIIRACPPIH